jgi:outer membrane biosynthesis protein TonB
VLRRLLIGGVSCWFFCSVACARPYEPPLEVPGPPVAEPVSSDTVREQANSTTVDASGAQPAAPEAGAEEDLKPAAAPREGDAGSPLSHRGLHPEAIRRVVIDHRGALQACYEAQARKDATLKGGVTVYWVIDASGSVIERRVADSTLGNALVEGCILREVGAWKFPPSDGTSAATFPFSFGVKR